jgi:hypothetical protein
MTDESLKAAWLGNSDTDEIMRRLRKSIVCSLMTKDPHVSASIRIYDKEIAARVER